LSRKVTERLNEKLQPGSSPIAVFCPMDGYHWPRSVLDTFDPVLKAHERRGAEFTFDGDSFLKLVESLRVPLRQTTQSVFAPSFDHAAKDPVDNDIEIKPSHRIVVFEGNYVCLNQGPWKKAADLMDLRWFIDVDDDVARERLAKRHLAAKIVETMEEGIKRADQNDLENGKFIRENRVPNIDQTVRSVEDPTWAPLDD
jgi:pantothenate kinase